MTYEQWVEGYGVKDRYTEKENWLIKWAFEVGARKAQPIGTYVDSKALLSGCIYEAQEIEMIVRVDGSGLLFKTTPKGLQLIKDQELLKELEKNTFLRIK